ncbi:MAG: hypothetical protein GEU86_03000 [Actinophytocola sp.]|nr:hypothetical protein [Actinophytocola sp.]
MPLGRGRSWWLPVRLVGIIRSHRRMHPAPWIYVAAAVLGAGLGLLAHRVLGWWWWAVAIGVVVAVALRFAATAFTGGRHKMVAAQLWSALLWSISPRKAHEHALGQRADMFRTAPFPLYGLVPTWQGVRRFGSSASSSGPGEPMRVTALGLSHHDPEREGLRYVDVEVRDDDARRPLDLAYDLAFRVALRRDPAADEHQLRGIEERPEPDWTAVTIPVDGEPVPFAFLADQWVATAEFGGHTVVVQGRRFPVESVELARITDLEPYLEADAQVPGA